MISVKKLLEGKQLNRIIALAPDAMVIDALELMTKENVGAIMVVENEKLVGIFSERDYARKGIIMGRKAKSTSLTEVMTNNVFTVTPEMNMEDCMQLFRDKRIRHLPVVHDHHLLGMLSIGDIVNAIIEEQKDHIMFLEKYISS
ncbi:MAG TPA: CBS domain-containing protein [Saprospiraceae bacterium]|nr:CBS domain-containing protein [Saprospiraceae bacterium]